ncbi:MAG: hypothetical protein JSV06_08215 [Myxococcales bacterium]|nr:MAG: hypothetical protein JSV06_08215 [Myxococcales bacterium]
MSQVLTVPTHFNDIGELSEGFLDRVEQDTLILYGPVAYEEGSEIEFAVLLADGTPTLEGVGRVRAAVDGGEDRVPETRYDVVVEALEFDARSEVVFERLVISRQAVSDRPPSEDDAPITDDMRAPSEDDAPEAEEVEMSVGEEAVSIPPDEMFSVAPSEDAPDTVPPEAYDDEDEDEPATVIAAVDAEALMAEADADADADVEVSQDEIETLSGYESEPAPEYAPEVASVIANASETEIEIVSASESELESASEAGAEPTSEQSSYDSEYAFEHGIAEEPKVGMPVPIPSMAAPPEAPPAPPTLRLAEPPEGLTRPSLAEPDDSLFTVDGEISDVHTSGLFAYEQDLPIPSRPPLPDANRAKKVAPVEAANDYDVEESEPPELLADDYEEVRLSDFAEAAEEG